jgi:hypothetical protein
LKNVLLPFLEALCKAAFVDREDGGRDTDCLPHVRHRDRDCAQRDTFPRTEGGKFRAEPRRGAVRQKTELRAFAAHRALGRVMPQTQATGTPRETQEIEKLSQIPAPF